MYQKVVLLTLGWVMALTRGKNLESPQDEAAAGLQLFNGAANCEEDFSSRLCDFPDVSEACEKNPEFKQNCPFSCSLSGQLWRAASSGNLKEVREALTTGANPLCQYTKRTAIHMAAEANHPKVVKALLDAGVDVNILPIDGETPTYSASSKGSIDALNVLIEHNANVNIAESYWTGYTPLIQAAWHGHLDVAKALIKANASIDAKASSGGGTALYYAATYGNHDIVSLLIEHNANVNILDSNRNSALIRAAWRGHLDVVKALINANASIDVVTPDFDGSHTALSTAVSRGHQDIALLLIEHNANVNHRNLLISAVRDGQLSVVKALINANASLDVINWRGNTALHYAAKNNNQDIAVLLIKSGAYARMPNKAGNNPADEARLAGHNQLAELIESYTNKCKSGVLTHKWC